MDFLNKALAQLGELFRSMTPGSRITAGLLLVVVAVSVGYLFVHEVSGPDEYLMNGEPFSQEDLPAAEAALGKAGLKYTLEGTRVRVARGQQAKAMAALGDANALPANWISAVEKQLGTQSWMEDNKKFEERLKLAKEQRISAIISKMRGIENAYVVCDRETKSNFNRDKVITASVNVRPQGANKLEDSQVTAVRNLVASAFVGMKPENVTVTDLANGRTYRLSADGSSADDDAYATRKQMYQQKWTADILNALSYVPDPRVSVNVELDREKFQRTKSIEHKPKTVTVHSTEKSVTRNHEGASGAASGRPGYPANAANAPLALNASRSGGGGAGGAHEEEDETQRDETNAVSGDMIEKESVGLTPKVVRVSVAIPTSYMKKVWAERNPTKEGQEPKTPEQAALDQIQTEVFQKIRDHVATLLPTPDITADAGKLVTVTSFQDITPTAIPEPGMGQNAMVWLGQSWTTLGLFGLGLVSLMMLRSMVRGVPGGPIASQAPGAGAANPAILPMENFTRDENESAESARARRLQRLKRGGPSLRDELSELVKEDPDTAANILRTWIGNAS